MGDDLLYEKEWRDANGHFRMTVDKNNFGVTRFFGKGSMDGTRAFVVMLDESDAAVGTADDIRAMVDLRELSGAPIRAQFILGKWLMNHKHRFYRIGVFGGKPWEMKLARAVAKIARFKNIGFFGDEKSTLEYLNG